jgi:PTH1 family peptidyl-tRNA hydrolase
VASIIEALGARDFARIRIGVGRPDPGVSTVSHVLGRSGPEEWELVRRAADSACEAAIVWIAHGLAKAQSKYNRKDLPNKE